MTKGADMSRHVNEDLAHALIIRASKTALVTAVAVWVSLVAFGNITDYGTNLAFVNHVLAMDTVFPDTTIRYRAIASPALHHAAYLLIIAAETVTAVLCWIGAIRMLGAIRQEAAAFDHAKGMAVIGLTLGGLVWLVGFMAIGGEWFGMWMSTQWNGLDSAFRFSALILAILIYVSMPDSGPREPPSPPERS
jgi:predicted small integral membrane protein